MHLDGDAHAVIGGELSVFAPVRRDGLLPLPGENLLIVRRPGAGDPVGCDVIGRATGAAGEVDDCGHAELLCQQDGLAADFASGTRAGRIRVQCIAVAAQCAEVCPVFGERALKVFACQIVIEHCERAVCGSRVVAGAQFDGGDAEVAQFGQSLRERKTGEQGSEDGESHAAILRARGMRREVRLSFT